MIKTLKIYFKFMAERKLLYGSYVFAVIAASATNSVTPYFYKLLVDAIPSQDYQKLLNVILIYIGVTVFSLLVGEASFQLGNLNLIEAAIKLRQAVFAWVQDLDFSFHAEKSTGSLISAFKRGDNAMFDFSFIIHHRLIDIIVSFMVMLYFFLSLDPVIAGIVIISIALTLIATKFLLEYNVDKRNIFNDEEDIITDIITDTLLNYETVKLFAQEKWEKRRLEKAFIPWRKKLWTFLNTYRVIDFAIGSIINVGIFAILYFSVSSTISHKMGVGDFVLVASFIGMFFPRLWDLVWSLRDMARSYSDIQKYFGLFDHIITVPDPAKPINVDHVYGEITFKNVKFAYKNRVKNAINGIDLKINQGQSVALVGKSGSGKTTLAKLLMRFYDVTGGEITVDGINIRDFTKDRLRSFIGVVPQEPILFNNTIAYNIAYGYKGRTLVMRKHKNIGFENKGPSFSKIKEAAKIANIDEFIERLPEKYETIVGERGVKLSGGQKQRLAIARMILSDPDIVIFDEATSQLDSESEKLIQEAFWKARRGKTTIIVAHRLSTIMRADKIVVLQNGRIKESGTHESLLENKDSLYSHFWNLQIKLD